MLHIIRKQLNADDLDNLLSLVTENDAVLLIEDAVYLIEDRGIAEKLERLLMQCRLSLFQDDLDARGLTTKPIYQSVGLDEWVDLTVAHQPILTW